ncbi:MAG: amylo-alpha-1,6-glucosidase [Syntrophobacteraceae bacterium]
MYKLEENKIPAFSILRSIRFGGGAEDEKQLIRREWLVANGLGGYASSTISGVCTRRYHGLLVAAMPAPQGRVVMLTSLAEELRFSDGSTARLGGEERCEGNLCIFGAGYLREFRLEMGLPVWRYKIGDYELEKRIYLPHMQNSVYLSYRLLSGATPVRLRLRPYMNFRQLHEEVGVTGSKDYSVQASGDKFEIKPDDHLPSLRMFLYANERSFNLSGGEKVDAFYRVEKERCYGYQGTLWSPGYFRLNLIDGGDATLIASTESWEVIHALKPHEAQTAEIERRKRLIVAARPEIRTGPASELVLTADSFIISPTSRIADVTRAHAAGGEVRSVIAGYHWFTDWGRDTMISMEGLMMVTGRATEAAYLLRTFAHYIRDGLVPNMFPEGHARGVYNTADATLWFFNAMATYLRMTGDALTLRELLPRLVDVVEHHVRGTRFGIGADPEDGLLRQGASGYQLTWMDAKVGDWVVTPRRGKAVEINALWYNALRILEEWVRAAGGNEEARRYCELADRVRDSFNRRFWYEEGGYLYDIVDGEEGDDPALRPNQLFAVSLPHPVLDQARWEQVLDRVREKLVTPFGLRTLAPGHPDYKLRYHGDVCTRDAAYHQGTVWPWLIGPFIDTWLKVHPEEKAEARGFLRALLSHMDMLCIGSINEVFDAEAPFNPEGCISQAWSVAEILRCWVKTAE